MCIWNAGSNYAILFLKGVCFNRGFRLQTKPSLAGAFRIVVSWVYWMPLLPGRFNQSFTGHQRDIVWYANAAESDDPYSLRGVIPSSQSVRDDSFCADCGRICLHSRLSPQIFPFLPLRVRKDWNMYHQLIGCTTTFLIVVIGFLVAVTAVL